MPVNDGAQLDRPGAGSHWSLLAVAATGPDRGQAWHLDSCAGHNDRVARRLAKRLSQALGRLVDPGGVGGSPDTFDLMFHNTNISLL